MSLEDDLAALTAPGKAGNTLPSTVRPEHSPKGWEAGVRYEPTGQMLVTTTAQAANVQQDCTAWVRMVEDLGLSVPAGWRVRLVEAKYDPVAWTRETPEQDKATTRAVWRYRFAVEPDVQALGAEDVAALLRDALRAKRVKAPAAVDVAERALVVVYADPQLGKVASGGGSAETVGRIRERFDRLEDHVRDLKKVGRGAGSAFWLDAGDGLEGFDNVASQAQTNDLTITEQVRGYRRLTFEGVHRLSRQFGAVTAAVCGSNHTVVRQAGSKNPAAGPSNDWGIEVLSQVQDAMGANPDAYGHVSFAYPERHRDTLSLDVAGTVVGLAHGHQAGRADRVPEWWKGQAFGHEPVGAARILVTGHWHHTRIQQVGDGRLWAMAPAIDNGSDWWAAISGDNTPPGMLVFSVGPDGWDDLRIL